MRTGRSRSRRRADVRDPSRAEPSVDELTFAYAEVFRALDLPTSEKRDAALDVARTPARMARMMMTELLRGYRAEEREKLDASFTTFKAVGGGMITESPIPFTSLCGHHGLPFMGEAHVGYIPTKRIVGLSKIPRVIDFFASKFQVQERLTEEVTDYLQEHLRPSGLIVVLEARHLCMEVRGVRKPGVTTRTAALRGIAMRASVKDEFYRLIRR